MNIAFDIGPLGPRPAGVGVYASSLAKALAARESTFAIAFIGRRPDATLELENALISTRPAGPYLAWVQRKAMRDAQMLDAQLAHFSDGISPLRRPMPVVLAVHDLSVVAMPHSHPRRRWARAPLVMISPRLAQMVIVPSLATADEVMRISGVSSRRINISPYAPQRDLGPANEDEIERTTRRHGLAEGSFILALGTVEPRKNHVRLIKAFEAAVRTQRLPDDIELVIAGSFGWKFDTVLAAIAESPIKRRIRTLGFVADNDVAGLMSGARFVAYLSVYEGFGLPVVEALACGAPILTSNISSMPEVGGDAAFYADPFDVASITDGLAEAYEAGEDRPSVTARSLQQAAKFSWQRAASEVIDTYTAVLDGNG